MEMILNGLEKDPQYNDKCNEYVAYIDEHIKLVKESHKELFENPEKPFTKWGKMEGEKLQKILDTLAMRVNLHDSSKYNDEEFNGYRVKFYPTDMEKKLINDDPQYAALVEANFQMAWFNHFTHNDHHPIYWKYIEKREVESSDGTKETIIIRDTPRDEAYRMGPVAILHMICDWHAMSKKFGGNVCDWYRKDASDEKKAMHPDTRKVVEVLLEQLYGQDVTDHGDEKEASSEGDN